MNQQYRYIITASVSFLGYKKSAKTRTLIGAGIIYALWKREFDDVTVERLEVNR